MASHDLFPKAFARLHPRFQTPYVAIIVFGLVACLLFLTDQIELMAAVYSLAATFAFSSAHLSVIRLRYVEPDLRRPFKIPLNIRFGRSSIPVLSAWQRYVFAWDDQLRILVHRAAIMGPALFERGGISQSDNPGNNANLPGEIILRSLVAVGLMAIKCYRPQRSGGHQRLGPHCRRPATAENMSTMSMAFGLLISRDGNRRIPLVAGRKRKSGAYHDCGNCQRDKPGALSTCPDFGRKFVLGREYQRLHGTTSSTTSYREA